MPTSPLPLTPYDTGERLEPRPWSTDGDPDRYGRVDFDDDEAATVLSVRVGKLASGAYALSVTRVRDIRLVVDVDREPALLVRTDVRTDVRNAEENR